MTKSMTGFGSAEGEVGGAQVSVEIRSVNHRFFNPSVKLPSELSKWEGEVREAMRKGISRGHVTLTARVDRRDANVGRVNEERFGAYVEQIRRLQRQFGLSEELDVGTVLRLPDVVASDEEQEPGSSVELVAIVERALAALDEMRSAEGRRLATYLAQRVDIIEQAVGRNSEVASARLAEQRGRQRGRVGRR